MCRWPSLGPALSCAWPTTGTAPPAPCGPALQSATSSQCCSMLTPTWAGRGTSNRRLQRRLTLQLSWRAGMTPSWPRKRRAQTAQNQAAAASQPGCRCRLAAAAAARRPSTWGMRSRRGRREARRQSPGSRPLTWRCSTRLATAMNLRLARSQVSRLALPQAWCAQRPGVPLQWRACHRVADPESPCMRMRALCPMCRVWASRDAAAGQQPPARPPLRARAPGHPAQQPLAVYGAAARLQLRC